MAPAGFEPNIPANERPQTHTLDGAAIGMGRPSFNTLKYGSNMSVRPAWTLQSATSRSQHTVVSYPQQ